MMALAGGGDATMGRHGGGGCEGGQASRLRLRRELRLLGVRRRLRGRLRGVRRGYAPSAGCSACANGMCPLSGSVASNEAPATIVVSLPADAKLTIDDQATPPRRPSNVRVSEPAQG